MLILDDVLATGGTLSAAARLFERADVHVAGFGVVLELGQVARWTAEDGRGAGSEFGSLG